MKKCIFILSGVLFLFTHTTYAGDSLKSFKNKFVSYQYSPTWKFKDDPEVRSSTLSLMKSVPGEKSDGKAIEWTVSALTTTEPLATLDDLRSMADIATMGTMNPKGVEKKISQLGKIKGTGLEISGMMVDEKSKITVVVFDHKFSGLKPEVIKLDKKDPEYEFLGPTKTINPPNHLYVTGYYITSYDNKPILTPEEEQSIQDFLNSLSTEH